MANTSSAKKAIRTQEKRTVKNLRRKRDFRDSKKKVLKAVETGDSKAATGALLEFNKKIDKATKTFLHKNTAARQKSRLAKQVSAALAK
jgi:small subunit ribosomal protein S20